MKRTLPRGQQPHASTVAPVGADLTRPMAGLEFKPCGPPFTVLDIDAARAIGVQAADVDLEHRHTVVRLEEEAPPFFHDVPADIHGPVPAISLRTGRLYGGPLHPIFARDGHREKSEQ